MTLSIFRLALVAAVATLLVAGTAHAGQIVFPSGDSIWVMNDDGSNKRQLVSATQVPDMEALGDPSVQPNGTEVAFDGRWNQASVEQNRFSAPGFCGVNCEGIYELIDGKVTRITAAPQDCGAQPCVSHEIDPHVGRDGSVAFVYQAVVSEIGPSSWLPIDSQDDLFSRDSNGAHETRWPTACDTTAPSGAEITDADILALNPLDPTQIAYGNCKETTNDGHCSSDWTSAYDVIGSGPSPSTAADDVIYHSVTDPSAQCLQNAGTYIGDIDFSPDATHLVEVHGGTTGAGIYTYAASHNGGAGATELLAIPHGWGFDAVRYIGSGRIGFIAGPSSDHLSLYTMPTTCTPAHCDVAAGTGVTNLTGSQYVSEDYVLSSARFAYTTSASTIKAFGETTTTTPSATTPSTTTPQATSTTATTTTPTTTTPCSSCNSESKLTASLARIATQRVRTLLRRGLAVKVTCSAACRLSASLKLKHTLLGTAKKRLSKRGKVTLTLHLSRKGAAALRRAHHPKLSFSLVIADGSGHKHATLKRTVSTS